MSVLKTGRVQVGQSNTPAQNFHWRNLLDGLLRLCRGNAEDVSVTEVMRVRADNAVEFPGGVADGVLGAGQTWQDVTASRAANTVYTNTTGRPIQVVIGAQTTSATNSVAVTVNGVIVSRSGLAVTGSSAPHSVVVPPGATYSVTWTNHILYYWAELR